MTRRPEADETIVLGERSGWRGGERFYLRDLAVFLHQSITSIRKWARRQRILKSQSVKVPGCFRVDYVTRYGAMRVIAHFRAQQGELHLRGKDYHRRKDMTDSYPARRKALLK